MREVAYIFEREERERERGGAFWLFVLDCGHTVTRKRYKPEQVHLMFVPLEEKLAFKRVQCHYCEAGCEKKDPWITIKAFGGPTP